MKKKLLLVLSMVIMVACLFVITASATVTTYDDAPEREKYQCIDTEIIEFYDGFKCPVSYVLKNTSTIGSGDYNTSFSSYMDFSYINGKLGKTEENAYTYADVKGFDIPTGITHVAKYAGKEGTTLKWITFPDTISSLSNAIFQSATGLEECTLKFSEKNTMRVFPSYMFFGCRNLKAFSMPDCFTSLHDVAQFSGCTNLSAVHLSESLETWNSGGGGSRTATFDDCNNMYFVNETFTYDNIPQKPAVYYFPANLSKISNNSVCRECTNLNDVLVFGTKLTEMPNQYFFQNGPANKIVFLGDMTTVATQYWGKTTHVYFANSADKSLNDVTFSGGKTAVFCNADGNTTHLVEPKKTESTNATCETNRFDTTYCFCGTKIDNNKEIENTKLGHDYTVLTSIKYTDYTANGTKTYTCSRKDCGCTDDKPIEAIIYNFTGYSAPVDPTKVGLCFGYDININALNEYNSVNDDLKFGVVGVLETYLGTKTPLTDKGEINSEIEGNVIVADISNTNSKTIDFIITGSKEQWESTQIVNGVSTNLKELAIIMAGYVYDGNGVHYIQSKGTTSAFETVSYNQVYTNS